jgi:hypothetical protein
MGGKLECTTIIISAAHNDKGEDNKESITTSCLTTKLAVVVS